MSNSTLFLMQAEYSKSACLLNQLQHMADPTTDQIVLMAESALLYNDPSLNNYHCYILKNDADILPESIDSRIQIIDYSQFSQILLQHTRCISLK